MFTFCWQLSSLGTECLPRDRVSLGLDAEVAFVAGGWDKWRMAWVWWIRSHLLCCTPSLVQGIPSLFTQWALSLVASPPQSSASGIEWHPRSLVPGICNGWVRGQEVGTWGRSWWKQTDDNGCLCFSSSSASPRWLVTYRIWCVYRDVTGLHTFPWWLLCGAGGEPNASCILDKHLVNCTCIPTPKSYSLQKFI